MSSSHHLSRKSDEGSGQRNLIVWSLAGLYIAFVAVLWSMGREFLSDSGFGLWTGGRTPDTSQWIADPYTTSHVLHGVLFYWLLLPVAGRLSLGWRFVIAAAVEAGWEILENSPVVIDRYRTATTSQDYYGDSILNSSFDLAAAMFGFWLAGKLGWRWMLALLVAIELSMLYFVRDNLTLNVLMLIHPFEAIKAWQNAPRVDPAFDGLELQMVDPRYYPADYVPPADELTGSLYRAVASRAQVYKPGDWNRYEITCRGARIVVRLNEALIQDVNLDEQTARPKRHDGATAAPLKDRHRRGHIGFQELSRGGGQVQIRSVRIQRLE